MALNDAVWQFPLDYPLKVIGRSDGALKAQLVAILAQHVADFDPQCLQQRPSRKGRYTAYTAQLRLTHKDQVEGLYADLNQCESVLWAI